MTFHINLIVPSRKCPLCLLKRTSDLSTAWPGLLIPPCPAGHHLHAPRALYKTALWSQDEDTARELTGEWNRTEQAWFLWVVLVHCACEALGFGCQVLVRKQNAMWPKQTPVFPQPTKNLLREVPSPSPPMPHSPASLGRCVQQSPIKPLTLYHQQHYLTGTLRNESGIIIFLFSCTMYWDICLSFRSRIKHFQSHLSVMFTYLPVIFFICNAVC